MNKLRTAAGLLLIELLLVATTVGVLVVLIGALPNSIQLIGKSKRISIAREIATKQLESTRSTVYANLTSGNTLITSASEPRLSQLPSGSGNLMVVECIIYAPSKEKSKYCPNNEQVKIVTVTVNWNEKGATEQVKLDTLISERGINQ